MSDADLYPLCPTCGAKMMIEQLGVDPKAEDRVFCADHGNVGRRDEITRQVIKQGTDKIGDQISQNISDMLRRAGFKAE